MNSTLAPGQILIVFSEPAAGTVLFKTDVIAGHGGPQIIVASQPGAFCEALDTKEKVKHPVGDVEV